METLYISGIKLIFGALVGFFVGTVVLITGSGVVGTIIGALVVGYLLFASSLYELAGAAAIWLVLGILEGLVHVIEKLVLGLAIAQLFGGGVWGNILQFIFGATAIYLVALIIAMIVWGKIQDGGVPLSFNLGCGAIVGILFGASVLWGLSKFAADAGAALVWVWAGSGALMGVLVSFIPGPP